MSAPQTPPTVPPSVCDHNYWDRVHELADRLGSDGCTMATGLRRECCAEHDIHYARHRTLDGAPLTRRQADARFLACMQRRSWFGYFSPLAWMRYTAVRLFGGRAWGRYEDSSAK